jgi:DNA-binding transcriptional LysR family regulator
VELRQLATFVAVAEEGSFTRASDRLHVVQSAVSAGIRNLERELGAALFDRSTHRVELTDAGHALLPEARATLAAADAARDAVDAVRGGVRGTVLLGTMQAQGMRAIDVPELLAQFHRDHPLVELHIGHAAGGSLEMATNVADGKLDLAFVALPDNEGPGVNLMPLVREPITVIVPATHAFAGRSTVSLLELADEPMVEFPHGWGIRIVNDRAFAAAGTRRTIAYEVNDTGSVIGFVRSGLALGMLPASMVGAGEGLSVIQVQGDVPVFQTGIVTPTNRRLSAAAQALVDRILVAVDRSSVS